MAAVIGYLKGNRGETSRIGSKDSGIRARLETWRGAVTLTLAADGTWQVFESVHDKHGIGEIAAEGRVDS